MSVNIVADLTKNKKQITFFNKVFTAVHLHQKAKELGVKETDAIRYFFYGGAIRGGKTFVSLIILVLLALKYPKSRWHIVRRAFPDLQATAIPSLQKIIGGMDVKWNKDKADYYCEFENGSKIFFMAESYQNDKDLNRFKGLETNGFLLEQIEELQKETYNKCLERVGSWYIKDMPISLILATFNPTYNWVKTDLHDVWQTQGAKAPYYYLEALPTDNPFVTEDQWLAWSQMDDEYQDRFIKGNWIITVDGQFITEFQETKHLSIEVAYKPKLPVWLSFDFNVDPMTCTAFQTDFSTFCYAIKEFRIPDSDTYEMCKQIDEYFNVKSIEVYITGDASGQNANSGARNHINHYQIIHEELKVPFSKFRLPKANPYISDSRTFVNAFFKNFPNFKLHPEQCPYLVKDIRFVMTGTDSKGKLIIQKTGQNKLANMDNKYLGHLLDNLRYFIHNAFPNYVKIHRS